MVSHRAINDIMQTPKKEVHFFFFSVCCIVFNCSWQLIMFDKKQKSWVKRIHLVTDDGLCNRKAFYKVKIVFCSFSTNNGEFINYSTRCFIETIVNFLSHLTSLCFESSLYSNTKHRITYKGLLGIVQSGAISFTREHMTPAKWWL